MNELIEFERISGSAIYVGEGTWCVGVHKKGTAGNLAVYGIALMHGEDFYEFEPCDKETACSIGGC